MIELIIQVDKTDYGKPEYKIKTRRAMRADITLEEVVVFTYLEEQIKPVIDKFNNEWDGKLPYRVLARANQILSQAVQALEKEQAKDTPDDTNKRADTDTEEKQG